MGVIPEGPRFEIQIGHNDGYRYIGIAPPLSGVEITMLGELDPFDCDLRHPEDGIPYTELGCDTKIVGDVNLVQRARSIANLLSKMNACRDRPDYSAVFVHTEPHVLAPGVHLFSET